MGIAVDHPVKRTSVDIDVVELEQTKEILGTETIRDTVNSALRQVNRRAALARAAARIEQGDFEVVEPGELAALRLERVES